MRHAILTALLFGAALSAARGQDSSKAVPVPGPPPTANYAFVTMNQTNNVAVRLTDGSAVTVLPGAVYGFNQPHDVIVSTQHRRVFVSNQGTGTLSVFNSESFQTLGPLTLPGCLTARGMSLSEDESSLFIAGGNAAGPAVWRVNVATLTTDTAPIGAIGDSTHIAEDCVVIRAANVGGSGNGPGRVYFSVQTSGTLVPLPGYIGVVNVLALPPTPPFPAPGSIQTQAGALAGVNLPTNMERTPDHRAVFVGCSKLAGFDGAGPPHSVRIIRIDVASNTASQPQFANAIQDLAQTVLDVSWRVDAGGANRGFVLCSVDATAPQIFEIFDSGAPRPVPPVSTGGLTSALTVRYSGLEEKLFVGDINGTGQGYSVYDATNPGPLPFPPISVNGVGQRCLNFAVMSTAKPVISDICPRAGVAQPSSIVTVRGAGFLPGATYDIGTGPFAATFIDSTTLMIDVGGGFLATLGLTVNNPNFQTGNLSAFYQRYMPPELRPPFAVTLPPLAAGYQMLSVPQYSTLTALKAAFSAGLGAYNPVLYRVFFYRGGSYVELNQLADDGCDLAGESFWVITRNGGTVTLSEPDVRLNATGSRVIPLNPGFNMISQPGFQGTGSLAWGTVMVTIDETDFLSGPVPVTSGLGMTIVSPALEYVGGAYVTADPLVAGRGYWVMNLSTEPAYLIFNTALVSKPGPSPMAGLPPPAGVNPPPPPSGMSSGSESSGSCGLLGLEGLLLLALAGAVFPRLRGLRKLGE